MRLSTRESCSLVTSQRVNRPRVNLISIQPFLDQCIHIYTCICIYMHMCTYIYRERDIDVDIDIDRYIYIYIYGTVSAATSASTFGRWRPNMNI